MIPRLYKYGNIPRQTAFSLSPSFEIPPPERRMFRRLKKFFCSLRSRKPQDPPANPADGQPNLPNAHQIPPRPSERRVNADAEGSNSLSHTFRDLALELRPSFPETCSWLERPDLQDIEEHAVDGGRFADVRKGRLDGRDVAVKSYRCYVRFDCDRVRMVSSNKHLCGLCAYNEHRSQRFYREAQAYSLLSHRNIVPFVGAYSSLDHPFSLVFDYMEHLNLSEYLRNEPSAGKLELVPSSILFEMQSAHCEAW